MDADEEDQIENTAKEQRIFNKKTRRTYTQGTIKEGAKYDRAIRCGFTKNKERLGFVNYFIAQKVRSKVTQADETRGNKIFFRSLAQE